MFKGLQTNVQQIQILKSREDMRAWLLIIVTKLSVALTFFQKKQYFVFAVFNFIIVTVSMSCSKHFWLAYSMKERPVNVPTFSLFFLSVMVVRVK